MNSYSDLQQAVERLLPRERHRLAEWIYTQADVAEQKVEESAAAYVSGSQPISIEEYLKLEASSARKHEYVAGEIFAMSGVSREHNAITVNLVTAISNHLRGGPCRVYSSDFKVRLRHASEDYIYYPDLSVACGADGVEKHWLTQPKLIVEVLSPSTEATDRREKALTYRSAPSLEEYVLVAQDGIEVTIQRREENWRSQRLSQLDNVIELRSIGLSLDLTSIYEGALPIHPRC